METNKKFKCKDEVIYQNRVHFGDEKLNWNYGIVNYEDEGYVYLVGGLYINKKTFKILHYEGNEHLVGTTDEPDEEVKLEEGEYCFFCNYVEDEAELWNLYKIKRTNNEAFDVIGNDFEYAIRFSDFNPYDMEETKKHILCVKNGKIVRYKG